MTDEITKSCETCRTSKEGLDKIKETGKLLSGANMICVDCEFNPGRAIFGDLFGQPRDNWRPRESLNTDIPESKEMEKKK